MKHGLTRTMAAIIIAASASPVLSGTVSGEAFYRERIALPPGAVFEAKLENVSRADAPATVIANSQFISTGVMPFKFKISYDDNMIAPRNTYAVRASIYHEGKLLFTTDTHTPAFDKKKPINIRLVAVSQNEEQATMTPDSPLRNTYWKLISLNNKPVEVAEQQREPHLLFSANEERMSGNGGCNSIMGGFSTEGEKISFKGLAGTMMACVNGMEQETAFLRALGTVTTYHIKGKHMDMHSADNAIVARFEAVALR